MYLLIFFITIFVNMFVNANMIMHICMAFATIKKHICVYRNNYLMFFLYFLILIVGNYRLELVIQCDKLVYVA